MAATSRYVKPLIRRLRSAVPALRMRLFGGERQLLRNAGSSANFRNWRRADVTLLRFASGSAMTKVKRHRPKSVISGQALRPAISYGKPGDTLGHPMIRIGTAATDQANRLRVFIAPNVRRRCRSKCFLPPISKDKRGSVRQRGPKSAHAGDRPHRGATYRRASLLIGGKKHLLGSINHRRSPGRHLKCECPEQQTLTYFLYKSTIAGMRTPPEDMPQPVRQNADDTMLVMRRRRMWTRELRIRLTNRDKSSWYGF